MNNKLYQLKRLFKQFLGFFPSSLPQGLTAFDAWAADIAETYTLPTSDSDSIRYALATMIMHTGESGATRSKYSFVRALRASAAKQVAGQVFYDIKIKQQKSADTAKVDALVPLSK